MAGWTSPRTWVAGAVVTAAQMNAHLRDNLQALLPLDQVAYISTYVPTVTQSGAVMKTVTKSQYGQIGKQITWQVYLTMTGSGTANNPVDITIPVTSVAVTANTPVGQGWIHDVSATTYYPVIAQLVSTTAVRFLDATAGTNVYAGQTGSAFAAALANTDEIAFTIVYEAA